MIDLIQDPLAERLRAIKLEVPPRLVSSALAAAAQPTRPGHLRSWRLAGAAIGLVLLASAAASYFAPRFADALAATPVIGGPVGQLLRGVGMVRVQGRLTSFNDSATSAGFRITLVGGYADAFQTLLILHIDDPRQLEPSAYDQLTLTDQFGRSYERRSASWTVQPGSVDEVVTFAPLQWPASWTGSRLTVAIASLQTMPPQEANLPGPWVLHGILDTQDTHGLAVPGDGRIGSTTFHFVSLRMSPAALQLRMAVDGALASRLTDVIEVPGAKPRPAFTIRLLDAHGVAQQDMGSQSSSNGDSANLEELWVVPNSGHYQLVVAFAGAGSFSKSIVVP